MNKFATFLCLLSSLALPIDSAASPVVLSWAALNENALLGPVHSTMQLEREVRGDDMLVGRAAAQIGLTNADFARVRAAVEAGRMRYVTLPRHLDAMAGMRGTTVFADRDVIVPEGVHGWEVDLAKDDGTVRVFFPNTCGNISSIFERYRVAAVTYVPPSPTPFATMLPPVAIPTPEAIATAVPDVALAVPAISVPQRSAPHLGWLGALILPLIVGLGSHSGGGGVPATVAPTPIHTICPVVVHKT